MIVDRRRLKLVTINQEMHRMEGDLECIHIKDDHQNRKSIDGPYNRNIQERR